jgi:hypothetical protein
LFRSFLEHAEIIGREVSGLRRSRELRAFAAQRWRAASLSSDEPRLALVTDDAGTAMTVLSQLRNSAH